MTEEWEYSPEASAFSISVASVVYKRSVRDPLTATRSGTVGYPQTSGARIYRDMKTSKSALRKPGIDRSCGTYLVVERTRDASSLSEEERSSGDDSDDDLHLGLR